MKFNVNHEVTVTLTEKGKGIVRDYWARGNTRKKPYEPWDKKTGRYTEQLHSIMHIFGPHMVATFDIPFETSIELEEPEPIATCNPRGSDPPYELPGDKR